MALENLKPTIWHTPLLRALQKALMYANITNQSYTGEARQGGTVKFNQVGEIDVNTYTSYSDMTFQQLDDAQLTMRIDQQKYFAFQLDETDERFIPANVMAAAMERAAYRVRDTIDQFIAGKYTEAGVTHGSTSSPKACSSGTVVQHLAEFSEVMNEKNIPSNNRWIFMPPFMFTKLILAKVVDQYPNADVFDQGFVGPIMGFTRVFMSNNVAKSGTVSTILASSGQEALGFASAIDGNIRIRPAEKRRAVNVDGLFVYGAKVIRPDMLACMYVNETAN